MKRVIKVQLKQGVSILLVNDINWNSTESVKEDYQEIFLHIDKHR